MESANDKPRHEPSNPPPAHGDGDEAGASAHHQPRIRRRNRMIQSCLECRRRKLKCDKLHPCTNCSKFARDCVFLAPALDSASQMKLTEIKEKMGSLERVLEHDVAKRRKNAQSSAKMKSDRKPSVDIPGEEDAGSDGEQSGPDDEKDLEPTPLSVVDAAFADDANDDMLDLGVKIGKMRMTERLGGFFRPRITEELALMLSDPVNGRGTVDENTSRTSPPPGTAEKFLDPGPTYIAPGSGFVFGDVGSKSSLMDFLPPKLVADTLIRQYLATVHSVARVVHWPSFQVQYENFWTNVMVGVEPAGSLQAVVFSVMFSAVASMTEEQVISSFSRPRSAVLSNFQTGTEVALGKAHFLRTTKIETLQALVIYLIPMCRAEMSRAHSVLVGTAIRLAECMGLHRDPTNTYGLSPLESHVRRTLWYQLCFLDIRTAEAQGPRPIIRRDDFDVQYPLNINDTDLLFSNPRESERWTDMTMSRIRFECNEMHRVIWVDRIRLEKKQASLTHVLGKIESFRKAMEAKYHPILDPEIPIQRFARLMMNVLLLRMHIMVLHRYHNSVTMRIPDRLRQIILTTGTQMMEDCVTMEKLPELSPWLWYTGALHQWHTAFLLLTEIFSFPRRREADRIWNVLDYVFEMDRSLPRGQKARLILTELRDRTAVYRDIRKIRAPVTMSRWKIRNPQRAPQDGSEFTVPAGPSGGSRPSSEALPSERRQAFYRDRQASQDHPSREYPSHNTLRASSYVTSAPPSVLDTADLDVHDWSFDEPVTLFRKAGATAEKPSPASKDVSSPSEVETDDSWPPFISQGQRGWPAASSLPSRFDFLLGSDNSPAAAGAPAVAGGCGTSPSSAETAAGPGLTFGIAIADGDVNLQNATVANSGGGAGATFKDDLAMVDIDWNEWDKIFPPEINTGVLNVPATNPKTDMDFNTL